MRDTIMPWGKHLGEPICELPSEYLEWALVNIRSLRRSIRAAMAGERAFRRRHGRPSTGESERLALKHSEPEEPALTPDAIADAVKAWYRQAAMQEHPDRGGTHDGFVAFQRQAEALKESLSRLGISCV